MLVNRRTLACLHTSLSKPRILTGSLELFWGMKGAGIMFGVVTRVKMRIWPVGRVWAGNLIL